MSWSFSAIGRPEKIAAALEAYAGQLSGPSLDEFNAAKPSLKALLGQNFVTEKGRALHYPEPLIEFTASGSGSTADSELVSSGCYVSIKRNHANEFL